MLKTSLFLVFSLLGLCLAGPLAPLEPAPGETCTEGGPLHISWNADTTGAWKTTTIELMTGNNINMVHLDTLISVDGTDPTNTSITIPCPFATPHSAIYFLQFTTSGQAMWTGRFAIVGPDGSTVPPSNAIQPDGSNIPWGTGGLIPPSFPGSPPPPTAPSGQIDASNINGDAGTPNASGGLPNSTEGLNSSNSSSTVDSSSSAPTLTGPLPGETTSTPSGLTTPVSSPSPTPVSTPDTNTSSTTNANGSNTLIPLSTFVSALSILITTFTLGALLS